MNTKYMNTNFFLINSINFQSIIFGRSTVLQLLN